MVDVRSLEGKDLSLLFEVEGTESDIYLKRGGSSRHLGRDLFRDFCEALLALLEGRSERPASRHDDGFEWKSFRNSFSPVHFFFGRETDGGFALKIWDGENGVKAGGITLDRDDARAWAEQLRRWLGDDRAGGPTLAAEPFSPALRPLERWDVRERDFEIFTRMARRLDMIILVCDASPEALKYIGREGYRPWPAGLLVAARTSPPGLGLAAADPADPVLRAGLGKCTPPLTYEQYREQLAAWGFRVGDEEEHFIIRDEAGNAFYRGYHLHGVYDAQTGESAYSETFRADLNRRFGEDIIRRGPHDLWPDVSKPERAGGDYGPQPPCTAYLPDGSSTRLDSVADMYDFYKRHRLMLAWERAYGMLDWKKYKELNPDAAVPEELLNR